MQEGNLFYEQIPLVIGLLLKELNVVCSVCVEGIA